MPLFTGTATGPSSTVLARTPLPADVALSAMAEFPLERMFTGWGPFPGVTEARGQTGPWNRVGVFRTIVLSDRGTAVETLVEQTDGCGFAYELTGFTNLFGRILHGVRGEWSAAHDGDGTILRWTWEFSPRPGWWPVVALGIVPLWRIYMNRMVRDTVPRLAAAPPVR